MQGLSAADLFPIEDACENRPLLDVAEMLLARVGEDGTPDLAIGERDARLLRLRELTLGPTLTLCDACPACHLDLEIKPAVSELIVAPPSGEDAAALARIEIGGRPMTLRRATIADIRASLHVAWPSPQHVLAARCLTPLDGKMAITADDLAVDDLALVAARLSMLDPQSDLMFEFACPACHQEWTTPLDIADYFWRELHEHAVALMDDIHDLARTYNWTEAAILALPAHRRNGYLARVRA